MDANELTRPAQIREGDWRCLSPEQQQLVASAYAATCTLFDLGADVALQVEEAITVLNLRWRLLAAAELLRRGLGKAPE